MKNAYARWMLNWENRLCFRSTNRVVRPFEWGVDWAHRWPTARLHPQNGHDPESFLRVMNQLAIEHSEEFFGYQTPSDFDLKDNLLRFTSPVETPYAENNIVHAQWYPAAEKPGRRKCAAIVLPHWNASLGQHGGLCRGLAKLGISALRLSLPYHDYRMPAGLERADYAMSSNVGRTIDATRQGVIDVRSCADWLESQGYGRIGLVGTSIGSCYAFIASAHDPRFEVNVFNHCSTYVADVVWEGLSTQHVRKGFEPHLDRERLRELWMAISPPNYWDKFAALKKRSIFIYTAYDTTFPTHLSRQVIARAREDNLDHQSVELPCGHYTLGEAPFKFLDGYHICNFLKRNL